MHVCQNKSLRILIESEDEDLDVAAKIGDPRDAPLLLTSHPKSHLATMELSMFALWGITGPKTMKLCCKIKGLEVMVMVDSGVCHCFINEITIGQLGLHRTSTGSFGPFGVRLGDGSQSISIRVCHSVTIELGPTTIEVDCYVFPLGCVDNILGVVWLETLGKVQSNWDEPSMKFKQRGDRVTLVRSTISARSLHKMGDKFLCTYLVN